jgi:hypothetical protein
VGPRRDLDFAPSEQNVGMMALLLGNFANSIYKSQSGLKVRKFVGAREMVFVDDFPLCRLRQLLMNFLELVALQRRNTDLRGSVHSSFFFPTLSDSARRPNCARLGPFGFAQSRLGEGARPCISES